MINSPFCSRFSIAPSVPSSLGLARPAKARSPHTACASTLPLGWTISSQQCHVPLLKPTQPALGCPKTRFHLGLLGAQLPVLGWLSHCVRALLTLMVFVAYISFFSHSLSGYLGEHWKMKVTGKYYNQISEQYRVDTLDYCMQIFLEFLFYAKW